MSGKPIEIGILFFPGMTQLDVTGPFEVFARLPNVRVHLLWKRIEPVISDVGLPLLPTTIFAPARIWTCSASVAARGWSTSWAMTR